MVQAPDRLPAFSAAELDLMKRADWLLTKRQIQDKIFALLQLTEKAIEPVWHARQHPLTSIAPWPAAKISRGENYRGLPYLILDYPARFDKADIFAYRTMFYWGNFFSLTLHLQGFFLHDYRVNLYHAASRLMGPEVYISNGPTPWQYHYGEDNYELLNERSKEKILVDPFVKLSVRLPLSDWQELPRLAAERLAQWVEVLWYS